MVLCNIDGSSRRWFRPKYRATRFSGVAGLFVPRQEGWNEFASSFAKSSASSCMFVHVRATTSEVAMTTMGINGFGRIGRLVFRAAVENQSVARGARETLTWFPMCEIHIFYDLTTAKCFFQVCMVQLKLGITASAAFEMCLCMHLRWGFDGCC